jgi:hypothetical protein
VRKPIHRMTRHVGHRIVTGPAVEPITRGEIIELLRNPPSSEYDFIDQTIPLARSVFEAATGIACITQTWRLTLDHWPGGREDFWDGTLQGAISELYGGAGCVNYVTMPRYPLQSIDSITTYGMDRSATSVTPATYFFADTASFPGRMVLKDAQVWPIALASRNAIEIDYIAGFGDTADDVPESIKRAIQALAVFYWKNRGDGCTATAALTGSGALQIAGEYVTLRL